MPAINELPVQTGGATDDIIIPAFAPALPAPQTRRYTRAEFLSGIARTGQNATFIDVTADSIDVSNEGIIIGDQILRAISVTDTATFTTIAAGAEQTQTVSAIGAEVGDAVILTMPAALSSGIICRGYISATNVLSIKAFNATGSSFGGGAQAIRALILGHAVPA